VESLGEALREDRFEYKDRIGSGAMGVVFRAYDRVRRHDVALKQLHRVDPQQVLGFKQEFRSLADIVHPHLVTLYELHGDDGRWSFSMELVPGVDFLEHVRPHCHLISDALASSTGHSSGSAGTPDPNATVSVFAATAAAEATATAAMNTSDGGSPGPVDPARVAARRALASASVIGGRLQVALAQLTDGIACIHRAGKLHRDIKPKNVLVDNHGRVVICDFGLAIEGAEAGVGTRRALGTPAYMAPEQAAGRGLSEASDWYAVGVMLFEALAGVRPFEDASTARLLVKKQTTDAPPLREVVPDVDERLEAICDGLLARDPQARPDRDQILATLGTSPRTLVSVPETAARPSHAFVGRTAELSLLRAALADAGRERCVTVLISGAAGTGKTALVQHALDGDKDDAPLVISGRCYERESVAHKAIDGMVDSLTTMLQGTDADVLEDIATDAELGALARLFPTVRRVEAFSRAIARAVPPNDPALLRSAAFAALRRILTSLAKRRRVVVSIDDLQWGDEDSAPFLTDLMYRADSPPVLFVATYLSDEADSSPLLRRLLAPSLDRNTGADIRRMELGPLPQDDARALARDIAGDALPAGLVDEAGGIPLYIVELATDNPDGEVSLASLIDRRIDDLDDESRKLLEAVAVAGHPMPLTVVGRATHVKQESASLARLRAARLLRTRRADSEQVAVYHGRVREQVAARLDDEQRRKIHRRIARAYEATRPVNVAALVEHWQAAGDSRRTAGYARIAAEMAENNAAFGRAAHYYEVQLEQADTSDEARNALEWKLADSLAHSGNLDRAAEHYLAVARRLPDGDETGTDLRRRALEALLRGGKADTGLELARSLVTDFGLPIVKSRRGAIASIVRSRLGLKFHGLDFKPRPESELDRQRVRQNDMCWSLATGISHINTPVAAAYQQRFLLESLRLGEPRRAIMALCLEIAFRAGVRGTRAKGLDELKERTRQALDAHEATEDIRGFFDGVCGLAAYVQGDFPEAERLLSEGERRMSSNVPQFRWIIGLNKTFRVSAMLNLGDVREASDALPSMMREAQERGDSYLETRLSTGRHHALWLAGGDLEFVTNTARKFEDESRGSSDFQLLHFFGVQASAHIPLYTGRGSEAFDIVEQSWADIRSKACTTQHVRIEAFGLRGRAAVAAAEAGDRRRDKLLAIADQCSRRIDKEGALWGSALSALLDAGIANQRGNREGAVHSLEAAIEGFAERRMALHEHVARNCRGLLTGDAAERDRAESWLAGQRIREPDKFSRLFAPGFEGTV